MSFRRSPPNGLKFARGRPAGFAVVVLQISKEKLYQLLKKKEEDWSQKPISIIKEKRD
jgi:hypothetical protein